MELWLDEDNDGLKLVGQEVWERRIESLRQEAGVLIEDEEACISNVKDVLENAVKKRLPEERFGIFLSGGLDSSLIACIAKALRADFTCYTAGFDNGISRDIYFAGKLSKEKGISWKFKNFSLEELERYFIKAAEILKSSSLLDPVSIGVSAVVMAASDLAREDGVRTFFGGLGAEEIFAGYKRHLEVNDVHNECWRGLKGMWGRDLVRDAAVSSALGIKVLNPFLDKDLILAAMCVPARYKVKDGIKKFILRKAAERFSVPKEISWREKKAAQYGSGFDKAMAKLAKRKGLEKGDYVRAISQVNQVK